MMTIATESLAPIEEQIKNGRLEEANRALAGATETDENGSDLMFLQGYMKETSFDREGAIEIYEKILERDPDHPSAGFRAALLADRWGDDEASVALYERCRSRDRAHVNALINLAVLYEDAGKFSEAEICLEDVLAAYPNHRRARAFLRSVRSSYTMAYDEKTQKERARHSAILDMPISEFELSVRSRNCLRQMNIGTLGDLLNTTEMELLSYKNFGETSLAEIKALLDQKSLRIGQALQRPEPLTFPGAPDATDDAATHLSRPIAELQLSVRSRKALQRLGVATLGELVQRTEGEMMAIKNFGQTSLTEIKRQLEKYGMSLRLPAS